MLGGYEDSMAGSSGLTELDGTRRRIRPRLTSVLRVVHAGGTAPSVIDEMIIARAPIIEALESGNAPLVVPGVADLAKFGTGGDAASGATLPPSSGLLSSDWFMSGFDSRSAMQAVRKRGRAVMGNLIGAGREALGGDADAEEASATAMLIYSAWMGAMCADKGKGAAVKALEAGDKALSTAAADSAALRTASTCGRVKNLPANIAKIVTKACIDAATWQAVNAKPAFRGLEQVAAKRTRKHTGAEDAITSSSHTRASRFGHRLELIPNWAGRSSGEEQDADDGGDLAAVAGDSSHTASSLPTWARPDMSILAELIGAIAPEETSSTAASGAGSASGDLSEYEAALAAVAGADVALPQLVAAGSLTPPTGADAASSSSSSSSRDKPDIVDPTIDIGGWLLQRCEEVAQGGPLPATAIAESIVSAARASIGRGGGDASTDAALQSALFDVLGESDTGLSMLGDVLTHTARLGALGAGWIKARKAKEATTQAQAKDMVILGATAAATGAGGSAGTVVVESAIAGTQRTGAGRSGRRGRGGGGASKKGKSSGILGDVLDMGMLTGGAPKTEEEAAMASALRQQNHRRREEADRQDAANQAALKDLRELVGGSGDVFMGEVDRMRASLPPGSTHTTVDGITKIQIPAPLSAIRDVDDADMVAIADLDDWAQVAFGGIERLNPLQSAVFPTAYHSNENMLVCAPTGAGKTNVAMLAVCKEISQHFEDGVLKRDEFKIVYVAPMKALAAEITDKFGKRLAGLGVKVRELTGDMQLTRREIAETQMLVVTPEKWDVITRKSGEGAGGITQQVRLLIIDEVHLLADGRGSVIESIVARTLRQVEASQSVIRLVGLSATLPNYEDVGLFLRVNPESGLFHFGSDHRPVPLAQTFIGVSERSIPRRRALMTEQAFDKTVEALRRGKQVMIFVHSRKDTARTGKDIAALAAKAGLAETLFAPVDEDGELMKGVPPEILRLIDEGRAERGEPTLAEAKKDKFKAASAASRGSGRSMGLHRDLERSKNFELKELAAIGIGIHHAGMLRPDRTLSEKLFMTGEIKVLCCTATLAWGVNLPAHTVIIKGTQVYNAEAGGFVDLSVLDVLQIFGRAGRPQFDTEGEACIVTSADKLVHYQQRLLRQMPIESSFIKTLPDHLNAEIVSGSVANIREGVIWMSYTYLFVRMLRNPTAYGIRLEECRDDPMLEGKRIELICTAAKRLDDCRLIRYDERSGSLAATDMGRVASHYYIHHESMDLFYRGLARKAPTDEEALALLCGADEFKQLRVRDEELTELEMLRRDVPLAVKGDVSSTPCKTNVLLQAYISGIRPRSFTLIGDTAYITQSAGRIARGLFEISVRRGWCSAASAMLALCKAVDRRVWWFQTPLRQLAAGYGGGGGRAGGMPASYAIPWDVINKIEGIGSRGVISLDTLADMSASDIGALVRHPRAGDRVRKAIDIIPHAEMEVTAQPITRSVLRVCLTVTPSFRWVDRLHGGVDSWWIWVEDDRSESIYHHEQLAFSKAAVQAGESQKLTFTIPIPDPMPPQLWVRATHDHWQGIENTVPLTLRDLVLPEETPPHTDLLDLVPLPKTALQNEAYEGIYSFDHFNPIQTQIFHVLYHTDHNVLLGAPTGSGKTVAAELALFRMFNERPGCTAVYVAPLKALVSERIKDWGRKFGGSMGKRIVELTGDATPDTRALKSADILVTTPEKWDGISRSWQRRGYVKNVGLVIIDEIHLLGEDRGPVLEVIVSRMRYIAAQTGSPVRVVGLSTALANASDLADWLGIDRVGLYNFRPSVRPIPMDVHIQGFQGKHYCPRMATMNKPVYAAIAEHSPEKPALVFVSSRRQTRLTALELISLCAGDENPRRFLHMDPEVCQALVDSGVKDTALRHTLVFGVGIHHAGLPQGDRDIVEELFVGGKIQVLVCTSTLAWGVNFPAHLVVVKGTEYFDGKLGRYVDFAITDVLQMMGRAGRPQYDDEAVAVIMVHEPKKQFYRKFLYEPFPVESQLRDCLHDHINAEVAAGTIRSQADAVDWLTWTYFFRRLVRNPSYYHLQSAEPAAVSAYLANLVEVTLSDLQRSGCVLSGLEAADALGIDPAEEAAKADRAAARRKQKEVEIAMGVLGRTLPSLKSKASDAGAALAATPSTEEDDEAFVNVEELLAPSTLGHIASFYYLSHTTVGMVDERMSDEVERDASLASASSHRWLLRLLSDAAEFDELPVRHNEELLNEELSKLLPWAPEGALDDPHVKTFLLLQAHMGRVQLPISDFINDTKSVLDQAPRVLNAMVDIASASGHLPVAMGLMELAQCLAQARFPHDSSLLQLPMAEESFLADVQEAVGPITTHAIDAEAKELPTESGAWDSARGTARAELRAVSMAELVEVIAAEAAAILPHSQSRSTAAAAAAASGSSQQGSRRSALIASSRLVQKCTASMRHRARDATVRSLLTDFPRIDISWNLRKPSKSHRTAVIASSSTLTASAKTVRAGQPLELQVHLRTLGGPLPRRAPCPVWPKPRGYGWWLIAGEEESGELHAVKRVAMSGRGGSFSLLLDAPDEEDFDEEDAAADGSWVWNLSLMFISDVIMGMDRQLALSVRVAPQASATDSAAGEDEDHAEAVLQVEPKAEAKHLRAPVGGGGGFDELFSA